MPKLTVIIPFTSSNETASKMTARCAERFQDCADSEGIDADVFIIDTIDMTNHGSKANAMGAEEGVRMADSKYVMTSHNDVIVMPGLLTELLRLIREKENGLVGCIRNHPAIQDHPVHISGMLFEKEIYTSCPFLPKDWGRLDVGDAHTEWCRDVLNQKDVVLTNTLNNPEIIDRLYEIDPRHKGYPGEVAVLGNDQVLWIHVGRGSTKSDRPAMFHELCDLYPL
jgi:hypothetical protein